MTWAHRHPYLAGALALIVLVLFILWLRRRSVSAGGNIGVAYVGPSEGLQAAQLQAGAQIQGMQYELQGALAQYTTAQNIETLRQEGETQRAYYEQQSHLAELAYQHDLGVLQVGGALALQGAEAHIERAGNTIVYGATQASMLQQRAQGQLAIQLATAAAAQPGAIASMPSYTVSSTPGGAIGGSLVDVSEGGGGAALPYPGTPGGMIHGVQLTRCDPSLDPACANANQAAVNASYDAYSGSYLGGGVYAGTERAYDVYGPQGNAGPYAGAETFAEQYAIYDRMLREGVITR